MPSFAERRRSILLFSILIAALALRLWGIRHGLPYLFVTDEYHEVMRAMQLGSGHFNFSRTGKGGLYLLLFVEYGVYFVLLKLRGVIDSAAEFARLFARDPSAFYLMGRVTVALFGTATVLIVFLVARRAFSARAGLLAAAFLAVNVLHASLSHTATVDVVMTCFLLASLLMAIRISTGGSWNEYGWAATFAALATTTKSPAILLVVPLLIAHAYNIRLAGGGARDMLLSRHLWLSVAIFAAILVATNPGILQVDFRGYVDLFSADHGAGTDLLTEDILETSAERPNLFLFYLGTLRQSMGWPLSIVALAALGYGIWRRTAADVILISLAMLFYAVISSTTSQLYFDRYVLPIIVVLVILAGRSADVVWKHLHSVRPMAMMAAIVLLIAVPGYQSVQRSLVLTRPDTRALAKEWFDRNVPQGSRVFIEGGKIAPVRSTVPLQDTAESIRQRIAYWRVHEPKQAEFLTWKLLELQGPAFNLELVPLHQTAALQVYRKKGIEYFVLVPERYLQHRRHNTKSEQLLDGLRHAADIELVQTFRADVTKRPGPTIDIYRIERSNNTGAS